MLSSTYLNRSKLFLWLAFRGQRVWTLDASIDVRGIPLHTMLVVSYPLKSIARSHNWYCADKEDCFPGAQCAVKVVEVVQVIHFASWFSTCLWRVTALYLECSLWTTHPWLTNWLISNSTLPHHSCVMSAYGKVSQIPMAHEIFTSSTYAFVAEHEWGLNRLIAHNLNLQVPNAYHSYDQACAWCEFHEARPLIFTRHFVSMSRLCWLHLSGSDSHFLQEPCW
jgi:hypothetical protein